jgi:cell division protein FtsL
MTDWVYESENRNYGIKKKSGIRARELFLALFLLVSMAGPIIFRLWVSGQITDTGYKIQELSQREESLMRMQEKLIVKEEILQSPERIEHVARIVLGMEPLRPEQVLAPRISRAPADSSVMAMTGY